MMRGIPSEWLEEALDIDPPPPIHVEIGLLKSGFRIRALAPITGTESGCIKDEHFLLYAGVALSKYNILALSVGGSIDRVMERLKEFEPEEGEFPSA